MTEMRAKVRVGNVFEHCSPSTPEAPAHKHSETVQFFGVAKKDGYDATGLDENNTFAKWSPNVGIQIQIANPALWGKFKNGAEFYVDFTECLQQPAA